MEPQNITEILVMSSAGPTVAVRREWLTGIRSSWIADRQAWEADRQALERARAELASMREAAQAADEQPADPVPHLPPTSSEGPAPAYKRLAQRLGRLEEAIGLIEVRLDLDLGSRQREEEDGSITLVSTGLIGEAQWAHAQIEDLNRRLAILTQRFNHRLPA